MAPKLSSSQIKLIFRQKKTFYKTFVKTILDIEGIQKENFECSMLDSKKMETTLNDKE
jgi:hypothetical protein